MPPPLPRSLFSLPATLRTSSYQQQPQRLPLPPQQRCFSASSRKSTLVETLLYCPTLLLDTLHSSGLPWHTAIPLSAVIVRNLLVYHLSTLPARKVAIIRANLAPLNAARTRSECAALENETVHQAQMVAFQGNHYGKDEIDASLRVRRLWTSLVTAHRVGKEFGAPLFSWRRSLTNMGTLIAMTEAVRMKCGAREGLLSLLLILPFERQVDPETARRAAMTADEVLVERLEAAHAARQAAAASSSSSDTTFPPDTHTNTNPDEALGSLDQTLPDTTFDQLAPLNTNTYASLVDPTLRTEGAAWFPDLTVADTTLMLPLALSATMALSVLIRPKADPTPSSTSFSRKQPQPTAEQDPYYSGNVIETLAALPPPRSPLAHLSLSQKIGLSVSLLFFFVAWKLPAGVLLYLISSMSFGWLQNRWLDLRYPLPAVVSPCRRPVRVKVRKEFRSS